MDLIQVSLLFSFILALSYFATLLVKWLALYFKIMDIPNERSSHSAPTPRIGGIGIVGSFFLGVLLIIFQINNIHHGIKQQLVGLLIGSGVIAFISFIDDVYLSSSKYPYAASVILKSVGQLLSAVIIIAFGISLSNLIELGWLGTLLTVLWVTWMANAYNFMDGIDGLAGGTGVIYALFCAFLAVSEGQISIAVVCGVLAVSCLGFLYHNFPPATIFMGDVGSSFLGFVFGALSVILATTLQSPVYFIAVLIIYSTFLYDTTFTLFRRIVRERIILTPHRTHLYQRLIIAGCSHKTTTLLYYFISIVLGIVSIGYVQADYYMKVLLGFFVLLVLSALTIGVYIFESVKSKNDLRNYHNND